MDRGRRTAIYGFTVINEGVRDSSRVGGPAAGGEDWALAAVERIIIDRAMQVTFVLGTNMVI